MIEILFTSYQGPCRWFWTCQNVDVWWSRFLCKTCATF